MMRIELILMFARPQHIDAVEAAWKAGKGVRDLEADAEWAFRFSDVAEAEALRIYRTLSGKR